MTTATLTLADFLRARLDEDEAPAREAAEIAQQVYGDGEFEIEWTWARHTYLPRTGGSGHSFAVGAPSPQRVLAEVDAKRRIVENAQAAREAMGSAPIEQQLSASDGPAAAYWRGQDHVLRLLALPYADHPDFREEWRPTP